MPVLFFRSLLRLSVVSEAMELETFVLSESLNCYGLITVKLTY